MTAYTDGDVTAAAAAIDACERGDYDGIPILDGRLAARAALDAVAEQIAARALGDVLDLIDDSDDKDEIRERVTLLYREAAWATWRGLSR